MDPVELSVKIQNDINRRVRECMNIILSRYPNNPFGDPRVVFDIVGTNGGQARPAKWEVSFNLQLAQRNPEYYLSQVVPHEIAHLIDWGIYRKQGHGPTWKYIMWRIFNLKPDRCHLLDVSEIKLKKYDTFLYSCACGYPHQIKTNTHKKIQALKKMVACAKCRKILKFEKYIGKT